MNPARFVSGLRPLVIAASLLALPAVSQNLSSVALSPTSVIGGATSTGTVTLSANAPSGGKVVSLSSGSTGVATVPASVTVASGTKTKTFTVATLGVDANATVTLTATAGGVAKTASLTVVKPALTSLAIAPATIPSGGTANGTLTLTGPAGPAGATVTLSSSKTTVATVPPSKLIPAGQSTATFTVTGTTLPAGGTATITATWGTVSKTVTVTLQPSASLQSVGLAASSIRGGQPVAGTVTISPAAPSGGVVVSLASDLPAAATVPATVTVPQGQTTAAFTATTQAVGAAAAVTITGTLSGATKTAPLTVEPATLTSLAIAPASIPAGTTATGSLTLDGPAGPSGATVSLYSNDPNVATVLASALIPAGQATGSFAVTGSAVGVDATTTVFATLADTTVSADVTVTLPIGALVGTVKDASTGFTLPWAHVVLTADPARETWSDGNGEYALSDLPPGVHTVEVTYQGFASATSNPVTVANGATATVPPVSIAPNAGRISGTILDQANGNPPLEGVLVTDAVGHRTATTDGNGHYELTGLAPGFTYLVISRNGYHPTATDGLSVNPDAAGEANVGLSPVSEGDRPGLIEGVVRDAAGLPVNGATVSVVGVAGLGTTTGADGRYALVVPAADAFVLEAQKAGHERALSRAVRASAGNRPYHVAHDFVLPLAGATGTIELRVFDPVSSTPFRADVWFRTPEGLWHAPVSETGIRTIPGVPAGVIWGCAGPRIVPPGGTLMLRCPGESIVPPGSPRWAAAGVVMNRYTYEPVEGATATFVNGSTVLPTTTDVNGLFSTRSGPVGDYSVTVTAPGFLETQPWLFNAADQQDSGSFYFAWLWPEMPSGSVSLTTPAEGAILTTSPIQVALSFTPARPGDQLLWAWASTSAGSVTSVTPAYSADGTSAVVTIEGTFPNGPLTLGVEAVTKTGAGFARERSVTVAVPSRPTGLTVTPSSVGGESLATAMVTIDPPAPAGGVSLGLASSSPVVTVPATLLFAEGETTRSFDVAASQVAVQTTATITATAAGTTVTATLTVNPRVAPPLSLDLTEGDLSGWQGFADPPWVANVSLDTTRVRTGSSSLKFVTDSGFDCGVRYVVPGGAHWDLRGIRFLTFWSFGNGTDPFQGEQPVVVLRGPAGSIRLQPPAVQTTNGEWRFHRVPLGEPSDWIVTTEGAVSLGDVTSLEIHQDTWGMGLTVFYDGVSFASDIPEDLAEGTAALWGTFASDNLAVTVVNDGSDVRSGASALRFDTASGFDTGLVFPKPGGSDAHWDLSDVRALTAWIRAENAASFQGNSPALVLRSPAGSVRYEPGDVLLNTPGWRYYEIPLDGAFPWTRTQEGTPDLSDVTAIELHGDTWGYGFRLQVDGVSVGRPLPLLKLPASSAPAGSTVTASVFLSEAAPAGGRTVLISSSDSDLAAVPASVLVPEGARSATFAVTAGSVTVATPVSVTVTDRGFSAWTTLRIDPVIDVTSLTLGASSVVGGLTVAGTVRIGVPAPAGSAAVTLTSSSPAVASVPAVVTVPEGATTASFNVTTGAVVADTPVTFTASAGAATATATLTVVPVPPLGLASVSVAPGSVSAGGSVSVLVTLTAAAPPGGKSVSLTSSLPEALAIPAAVTVAEGATTASVTATAPASAPDATVTITATDGPIQRTATVAVLPAARIALLSFAASGGFPGESLAGTLTLTAAAPVGGYSVPLVSSLPDVVSVPATVVVPAGQLSTTFQAVITAGSAGGAAKIVASRHGATMQANVDSVTFTSLLVSPAVAGPRIPINLRVNTNLYVPVGRVVDLALSSSNPAAVSVPATAQIRPDSTYVNVPLTRTEVASDTTVEVTVTALGVTRTATVVLESLKLVSVAPQSGHTTVAACSSETMRITSNATAPAGGATVELQVENGSLSGGTLIPGSSPQAWAFVLPAGQSTLDVSTRASWTAEPRQLVTTARLGQSQAVHTMAIQAGTVALSASPSTAPRGSTVRLVLTTSGGACDSGSTVNVPATSSNSAVFPVPAAVHFGGLLYSGTIPVSWSLDLPVPATALSGVARLTFTVFGTTVSVDVTVPEASLSGLSLNPTEAPSGAEVTGLVTLDAPAPEPGITILLGSSDPSRAVVPVSVLVPAGVSSVSFPLIPQETGAMGDVTISATLGAGSRTTSFRTLPSNAARIVGTVVDATYYDFDVPISGATATHLPGPGQFLTAADGAFRLFSEPGTATVQVAAPGFLQLATAPATLAASEIRDLGTLRMRRPGGGACGLAGTVVNPQGNAIDGAQGVLEGYDLAVTTDGAGHYVVNLPNQRARYRMTFSKPGYQTWTEDVTPYVTVAPWFCPGAGLHDFVLDPNSRPRLIRGTFEKTSMLSRSTARIEVVLSGGAPAYGANVSVARADEASSITSYDQFSINPGETGAGKVWLVQLPEVSVPMTVQYALFYGGETKWTSIEVVPETVSITCPSGLTSEATASCTLTLKTGPAPDGGAVVLLTSSAPQQISVPASITVPQGQTAVSFTLTVGRLYESIQNVVLKGRWAGGWGERYVSAARPDLTRVAVLPVAVIGGNGATGTVTLSQPAYPTDPTVITLESLSAAIIVPATVSIAPGETTATFPIATTPVAQPTTGVIRGRLTSLGGSPVFVSEQRSASLLLTTSTMGLVCTPTEVVGGRPASCQLSLAGSPAPAGGTAVALTSSSSAASVPASATVPEGQFALSFTVTTTPTLSTTSAVIRATVGSETAETTLTIGQITVSSLGSVYGTTITGGFRTTADVTLNGPAPAGGILVQLSSASPAVTVPSTIFFPEGVQNVSFEVTTVAVAALTNVDLSATSGSVTVSRTFAIKPQTWRLSPLAPGRAVAGAADVTLYGREFLPSNSVYLAGPVYSATAPDTPLCDEPAGACPGVTVQGVVPITPPQPSADRIVFTVPSSLSPGYYTVRAKSAAGALSAEARWLLVDSSSTVVPALAPEQHGFARPIISGQTVTGTFVENGDTSGSTNDFNLYYFVAAAGTQVSVRVERADTSLPWEHPDSLDPEVSLIAPDGFVYENEGRQDVTPATDLNAEVTNLVLPQTGMWLIAAGTSRGHGDYRLTYTMTPPGSVPLAQRIVALTGRATTAPTGTDVRLTLAVMDPRGYLLSGARVTYTASYPDAGAGAVEWPDGRGTDTAVDGLAQRRFRTTTAGTVDVATNLSDVNHIITNAAPDPATEALVETTLATLPRYQPLAHHAYAVRDVDPDGNVTLDLGPVRTFKPAQPSRLRTEWKSGPDRVKTLGTQPAPTPDLEPSSAPRPLPFTESVVAPECTAPTVFRHVAFNASAPKTPYSVTLTDVTPETGHAANTVPIGEKGIEGYRIEKTVKLKVDVKDRDGNPPPHPVLLRLTVGGPHSGRLIVGAPGAQHWCKEAFVVWHPADSQGNPGTDPLTFDYTLGTLSLLPGVEPDPDHPGQVKPVWGPAESLNVTTEVVTSDATVLNLTTFLVRPQPGRPHHLLSYDRKTDDDRYEWWNGFRTYFDPATQARTVGVTLHNSYYLADQYDNIFWGTGATRAQHGGSRLSVQFPDQKTTGPDLRAYALDVKWWADGSDQMPSGLTSVGLYVSYPAEEGAWTAGEVSRAIEIDLQGGNQTHLKSYGGYEARFGIDDGGFPMSVSPGATEPAIPNVTQGPAPAPPRSLDSKRRLALVLVTGREAPSVQEVFRAPHHRWEQQGTVWVEKPLVPAPDPHVDVASKPRLKLKLVDVHGNVQTAAGFKVHFCPRLDHEGSPVAPEWSCPTTPVESTNGVIDELTMNPGVVGSGDPPAPDATGYLGIELTTAPMAPGTYYVYVESLDKDVKVRDQSLLYLDESPAGQFQGGFALCTVDGGEFLDENFARLSLAEITEPRRVYVRYHDQSADTGATSIDVLSFRDDGTPFDATFGVSAQRVGESATFLSTEIELRPVWASAGASSRTALSGPVPSLFVSPKLTRLLAKRHQASIAQTATRYGPAYLMPVGRRAALGMYVVSITHPDYPALSGTYAFVCAPGSENDYCGGDRVPDNLISWEVPQAGSEFVRIERETSGPNLGDFPEAWYARGLRITTNRMPPLKIVTWDREYLSNSHIAVKASLTDGRLCLLDTILVEVRRPTHLGARTDKYPTAFLGETVLLEDIVIAAADEAKMPPHYLMGQLSNESGGNTHAYRYEPPSRDFRYLVGDTSGVAYGTTRFITNSSTAFPVEAVSTGGTVQALPCERDWAQGLLLSVPCDTSPARNRTTGQLTRINDLTWKIPGHEKVQLDALVTDSSGRSLKFTVPCYPATLGPLDYCVNGDSLTVHFGSPPTAPVEAQWLPVRIVQLSASRLGLALQRGPLKEPSSPEQSVGLVRQWAPQGSGYNLPTSLTDTIRTWAQTSSGSFIGTQTIRRYGFRWDGNEMFDLLRNDPSFEVQAQWFGAASFGLLQVIPDDLRGRIMAGVPPSQRSKIWAEFDPAGILHVDAPDSPLRLWDPRVGARMGAQMDALASVKSELDAEPYPWEDSCVVVDGYPNDCTWRRVWKRRFRVFNIGRDDAESVKAYGDRIVDLLAPDFLGQ